MEVLDVIDIRRKKPLEVVDIRRELPAIKDKEDDDNLTPFLVGVIAVWEVIMWLRITSR